VAALIYVLVGAITLAPLAAAASTEEAQPVPVAREGRGSNPIWSSALRLIPSEAPRLEQRSSSANTGSNAGPGLIAAGAVSMGIGAGLGFYGVSDKCYQQTLYTTCDKYYRGGVALLVGGLAVFIAGAIIQGSSKRSAKTGSDGPVSTAYTPPSLSEPLQPFDPPSIPAAERTNTLPPAQAIGRNRDGSTTTTIRNNTRYDLRVSTGGFTFIVSAGRTQTIKVIAGVYQEVVEAIGSGIDPYVGRQEYRTGVAYDETYYITTRVIP
jgi:hypothetical protein